MASILSGALGEEVADEEFCTGVEIFCLEQTSCALIC